MKKLMKWAVSLSVLALVGCGGVEEMQDVGEQNLVHSQEESGQSTAELASDDPIQGIWKSGGWAVDICPCTDSGKLTATPIACHPVGSVVFANIVRTSCSTSTSCSYTATRYTGGATECSLRTTTVTIRISGTSMIEYENGQVLRYWNR